MSTKQPGLDGRHRDKDGKISEKHGDTLVGSLRETYGAGFLPGVRKDAKLETIRERTGKSLSELVKDHEK